MRSSLLRTAGRASATGALLFASACSDSGSGRTDADSDLADAGSHAGDDDGSAPSVVTAPDAPDEPSPITAPVPGEWTNVIWDTWELEPGTEGYWCRRLTVTEDIWLTGVRSIAPPGTHHTSLGKDSGGPDGTFRCGGFSIGSELVFASGVGADPIELSDGLALKLEKDQQLILNLHVFNTGDELLSGKSGIEIRAVDPADVKQEVAYVLAGVSGGLTVVPGESTQVGHCTMSEDVTILSVMPHMHTRGVHELVTALTVTGARTVLHDGEYDFSEQRSFWLTPPAVLPAGDKVEVTCTYRNESANTIRFGEGTEDEMCYAGLYHYPRFTNGSTCQL